MPAQPGYSQLHINAPLTNVSVAYQQSQDVYIADKVFPQVPVDRQGDLYFRYQLGDWIRAQAELRAPGSETAGGGYDVDTDSYFANVFGVHKDIDDQTLANAPSMFNLERDAAEWVTQQLLLKREKDFVASYIKTGVWTGSTTGTDLTTSTKWDASGSAPVEEMAAQRLAIQSHTGIRPNTLVLGALVPDALFNNAEILDRIKYTGSGGFANMGTLAALFGVDRILVAGAIQNTAAEGATDAIDFITKKSALLCYSEPNPGLMKASAGYVFTWNGLLGAGAYGTRLKSWYIDEIASTRVEGEVAYAMKVVAPVLGAYFTQVLT